MKTGITKIGVAGAGVMGSGIAQVMAISGCEVVCLDIDASVLKSANENIEKGSFGLASAVEKGKLTLVDHADCVIECAL